MLFCAAVYIEWSLFALTCPMSSAYFLCGDRKHAKRKVYKFQEMNFDMHKEVAFQAVMLLASYGNRTWVPSFHNCFFLFQINQCKKQMKLECSCDDQTFVGVGKKQRYSSSIGQRESTCHETSAPHCPSRFSSKRKKRHLQELRYLEAFLQWFKSKAFNRIWWYLQNYKCSLSRRIKLRKKTKIITASVNHAHY